MTSNSTSASIQPKALVLGGSSNGVGTFKIIDFAPETLSLTVTSNDNTYAEDTRSATVRIQFVPGAAAEIVVQGGYQFEAGGTHTIVCSVLDAFHNPVADGTTVSASTSSGGDVQPKSQSTRG